MIDLHLHSTCSDGSLRPTELVTRARRLGLRGVGLTDHDTVAGVPEFVQAGKAADIAVVPGVEISAEWPSGTMHILGYFVDPSAPPLVEALEWMRAGRHERNRRICERLRQLGYAVRWEDVEAVAAGEVIGRPHIAEALRRRGYVGDIREAFDKLLGENRPAYVERRRLSPGRALAVIHESGGLAVLAHPVTLNLRDDELEECVRSLTAQGLDGIECYYPEHDSAMTLFLLRLCRRYDLAPTGGSDYHGDNSPGIEMGRGSGNLAVPDEVLDNLRSRLSRRQGSPR